MKKYISAKRQRFGGCEFCVGEEIPTQLIDTNRVPVLLQLGRILTVDAPAASKVEETVTDKFSEIETGTEKPTKTTSKKKASK